MSQPESEFSPDSQRTRPSPGPIEPTSGCGVKIPGCALGCAAVIGVVLLLAGAVLWWFVGAGTQHPTEAAAGPESTGSYRLGDLGADEEARAALEAVVREIQRRSPPDPGDDLPSWVPVDDPEAMAGLVAKVLPREGTLAFERVPGGDEQAFVLAVNLRGFTRPLRKIFEGEDARAETYRGTAVVKEANGDTSAAMVDGTLVLSDDQAALRAAIDRLLDGDSQPVASRLEILEPAPGGALLSGGTSFEAGELARMLRDEAGAQSEPLPVDPARLEGVRRLELVVDGVDPRAIRFRLGVAGDSADSAEEAARAIDELLRDELASATYEATARTSGAATVLDVELTGWVEPFAASFADGDDEPTAPEAPSPE